MQGYRFYEEFGSKQMKRKGISAGNVVAVFYDSRFMSQGKMCVESVASVFSQANSAVCGTSVSEDWLSDTCKRISEKRAREIHSNLFSYLDSHN